MPRLSLSKAWVSAAMLMAWQRSATALGSPVATESGLVEGTDSHGVRLFAGLPFAAPPVGDLRWRAPQPPASWSGVRAADHFSPICPQHGAYPEDSPPEPSSEDCLYLNLWVPQRAPDARAATLPVMVWIYGGGLMNGSASTPLYAGDQLARQGVIVVTVNYRLGALGYLALPELTAESDHHVSGNYGLLDQIAALAWVHRNIEAFGGDPARVTVFGQSSGSISISALTTSPLAAGLFQRAIGESGGLFEPLQLSAGFSLKGAEASGQRFVQRSGAASLAALRALSAEELLKTRFIPNLIVDGFALPEAPFEAYRHGRQNKVDLLVGSNADEGHLFFDQREVTAATLNQVLAQDFSRPLVSLIGPPAAESDEAARSAFVQFEGDMRFGWDMWTWARLQAGSSKGRAFLYRFSGAPPYRPADKYFGWGASHGMEMPYVFGHLAQSNLTWTDADRRLATTVSGYWTNFAKLGDPNAEGLPAWPAFTPESPTPMLLGERIAPGPLPGESELRRIDRLYAAVRWFAAYGVWFLTFVVAALCALVIRRVRRRAIAFPVAP